ncbi:uncharacterized protein BJ171DRAFT_517324 [Polychytrium aggregatum]|uniref:uncharacterized protein n=1 Tax=Polychytrium aggregatum TaxID=110093 RepID=UPI0022FE8DAA|nr:uncharacterized protein BJ171DRAFT_517324 [Polychytrium aggregatum]KAI9199883.1 hypothetical protein BJ171DRAFT_517324 [Polychytrium aggregatum]
MPNMSSILVTAPISGSVWSTCSVLPVSWIAFPGVNLGTDQAATNRLLLVSSQVTPVVATDVQWSSDGWDFVIPSVPAGQFNVQLWNSTGFMAQSDIFSIQANPSVSQGAPCPAATPTLTSSSTSYTSTSVGTPTYTPTPSVTSSSISSSSTDCESEATTTTTVTCTPEGRGRHRHHRCPARTHTHGPWSASTTSDVQGVTAPTTSAATTTSSSTSPVPPKRTSEICFVIDLH